MEIRGVSSAAHAMNSAVGTTAHEESAPVSKQDQMDFSKAWQQFMGVSNRVSTMSSKAEQLSKILRNDTAFAEDRRRSFLSNPVGRELAKELILNGASGRDRKKYVGILSDDFSKLQRSKSSLYSREL